MLRADRRRDHTAPTTTNMVKCYVANAMLPNRTVDELITALQTHALADGDGSMTKAQVAIAAALLNTVLPDLYVADRACGIVKHGVRRPTNRKQIGDRLS
jgi:hypothetical protein